MIRPVVGSAILNTINTTVAFNHAESAGGGIFSETTASPLIGNTIIDQNTSALAPNIGGQVTTLGNNFVGDLGTDLVRTDLGLGPEDIVPDITLGITNAGLNPVLSNATGNGTYANSLLALSLIHI